MKKRRYLKKGLAILLTAAMVAGLIPAMSGGVNVVKAETGNGTGSEPSVSAFATKTQLMNAFTPGEDGTAANYAKLVFGKNSSENSQEWYILGKDTEVSGDNTIIFAASPMETNQVFNSSKSNNTYYYGAGTGYVDTAGSIEVYANHYGASALRNVLQTMATNTSYFTAAEQGLMNDTTVTTKDTKNSNVTYTTRDKLYALATDRHYSSTIKAGTNNQTVLAMNSYWSSGYDYDFWLRSPVNGSTFYYSAYYADPGGDVKYVGVEYGRAVQPASNLNLSSVLFASSATTASSETVVAETITSGTAMTLRLDGSSKNIGVAIYNAEAGTIEVRRGSTSKTVALVVQGKGTVNGEEKDWYYSKQITGTEVVNVTAIVSETNTPASIDLSTCKIWLEITDTDGLIYAVNAEKEIEKINTTYVTKEQLMNSFKPYSDGTAANYGKLVFGKKTDGTTAQEWYILGKDSGVSGDNTIIFAASPIATGKQFNSSTNNKTYNYEAGTGYGDSAGSIDVYPNHYGASVLRVALQSMAMDTSYFTAAEQDLMNLTTVKTKDTNNSSVTYTTTEKLYALQGDYGNDKYLWAGNSDSTVLAMNSYWSIGDRFWLRSPNDGDIIRALLAEPGYFVGTDSVNRAGAVQPASNLNLSSVLFASSAQAASAGTVVADTIASDTAMTLRLDGTDKEIGAAYFDATKGVIVADKAAAATGTVSLVVQGNDGTNDWYYSVQVEGRTIVKVDNIKNACTLSANINLADCKIWLETTLDNVAYARTAEPKTFTVSSVTSVEVTGMKPVGGTAFNTTASCSTTGIATTAPAITYKTTGDSDDEEVTGIAEWNTTYKTNVTLATGIVDDVVYVFGDSVSVTVDGEAQSDSFVPNVDGTVTVTKRFTTAKRKIASVAAPEVPTDNTFTTYYGYEGYDEVLSDVGNSELGKQAMVTLEGTELVASTTEDLNVTWSVANADDAPYDKTPGAENIFRWTIPASEFPDYDASVCQGYDAATGNITDTVTITNKAATPVTITGTDSSMAYTGETIDVSQYFTIDSHAGTATYSLVTGADGGTGEGTLSGTILTVTKTGTFKIKVNTAANGIYGAGEKLITLTVSKKAVTITAKDQTVMWNVDIDRSKYTVSEGGLLSGDSITEITLTPSTTALTENGTISISGVKIENVKGVDVTGNYDITPVDGTLKIVHNTTLAPDRIEAVKTRTAYTAGDTLNVDDITVTAHYEDGYSEKVTDYTTNVSTIDMSKAGDKTLTVSYTENGVTKTKDIIVTVAACTHEGEKEVRDAKTATCTEKGYTGDTYCKHCGTLLETGTETDMTPHTYVNGVCSVCDKIFETTVDGITYKAVTETGADGKPAGKLVTVSGNDVPQVAVAVAGTGDDFNEKNPEGKVAVPSEITVSGSEQTFVVTKISDNAFSGVSVTEIVVPATVSEVGTGALGGAATITFKGTTAPSGIAGAISEAVTTINVPEGAGDSYREAVGETINIAEEHTHVKDNGTRIEPTCEEKGSVTYKCTKCGEVMEVAELDAFGHSYTSKVTKAATITSTGIRTYTCTRCGHKYTEVIPKLPIVAPAKGKKLTDTASKAVFTVTKAGKVTTSAGTGKVTVTSGEVAYTKSTNTSATTLTIPSTVKINGITYKVTSIGANAFSSNKKLTNVTMGSYIKTIGSKAFYKCTKLKTVKIGKSVTTIGASAFYGCTKLDTVSMGAKVATIGDNAFYKCTALKAITIPATVKKIGKQVFYGCKNLKTVTIKTTKLSGSKVGSKAFTGIYSKATVKVPKTKYEAYKKLLKAKGLGAKAVIKK